MSRVVGALSATKVNHYLAIFFMAIGLQGASVAKWFGVFGQICMSLRHPCREVQGLAFSQNL